MATPPTFVAEYETVVNTTTSPKTMSVTTAVGDRLIVFGVAENRLVTLGTPSGGTGSWSAAVQEVTATPTSDWCSALVWTKTATAAETFTLSITRTGDTGQFWGWICIRVSGSDGFGVSGKANASSAAPSLALTCSANSMLLCLNADWNALSTSRTWRTINGSVGTEQMYVNVSGRYTAYANRWNDVGAAGSKTVGLTAPSTQKYSLVAIEILGAAGSSPQTVNPTGVASGEAEGTPSISTAITVSPTGVGSGQALGSVAVSPTISVTPAGVSSGQALGTPTVSTAVTVSPAGLSSSQAVGTPAVSPSVSVSPGGISSGTAVGTPSVTTTVTVTPSGVGTGAAVGTPSVIGPITATPTGIGTGGAVGTPGVTTAITVAPISVGSSLAVGTPDALPTVQVAPEGLSSSVGLGNPTVDNPEPTPAIDSNVPWSLQIQIPWRTLDVDIPRRTLDVELPELRQLEVDIPGGRSLEIDIPQLTLEIDIPQLTLEIDT